MRALLLLLAIGAPRVAQVDAAAHSTVVLPRSSVPGIASVRKFAPSQVSTWQSPTWQQPYSRTAQAVSVALPVAYVAPASRSSAWVTRAEGATSADSVKPPKAQTVSLVGKGIQACGEDVCSDVCVSTSGGNKCIDIWEYAQAVSQDPTNAAGMLLVCEATDGGLRQRYGTVNEKLTRVEYEKTRYAVVSKVDNLCGAPGAPLSLQNVQEQRREVEIRQQRLEKVREEAKEAAKPTPEPAGPAAVLSRIQVENDAFADWLASLLPQKNVTATISNTPQIAATLLTKKAPERSKPIVVRSRTQVPKGVVAEWLASLLPQKKDLDSEFNVVTLPVAEAPKEAEKSSGGLFGFSLPTESPAKVPAKAPAKAEDKSGGGLFGFGSPAAAEKEAPPRARAGAPPKKAPVRPPKTTAAKKAPVQPPRAAAPRKAPAKQEESKGGLFSFSFGQPQENREKRKEVRPSRPVSVAKKPTVPPPRAVPVPKKAPAKEEKDQGGWFSFGGSKAPAPTPVAKKVPTPPRKAPAPAPVAKKAARVTAKKQPEENKGGWFSFSKPDAPAAKRAPAPAPAPIARRAPAPPPRPALVAKKASVPLPRKAPAATVKAVASGYKVGDRIEYQSNTYGWIPGRVTKVGGDGSYEVDVYSGKIAANKLRSKLTRISTWSEILSITAASLTSSFVGCWVFLAAFHRCGRLRGPLGFSLVGEVPLLAA